MVRAIFFDRDGVVNHTIDRGDDCFVAGKKVRFTGPWMYEEFKIREGVSEIIQELKSLGFLVILITNQPDVKYGVLPSEEYEKIMSDIYKLGFNDVFVCMHGRDEGCQCKKPKPGMLLQAAEKHNVDLASSFFVGDTENDVMAGKSAGCITVLIEYEHNREVESHIRISDLRDVLNII